MSVYYIDPETGLEVVRTASGGAGSESAYLYSSDTVSLDDGESISSGWLDMEGPDKYQLEAFSGTGGMTLVIDSSSEPDGAGSMLNTTTPVDLTFYLFNAIARQRYMRFGWRNDTGSTVTGCQLAVKASYGSSDKLSVFPVLTEPTNFSQAALVQAISKAQQPSGAFVNEPADDTISEYTTPLGPADSVTIGPFNTVGFKSVEMYIATDQVSATDGIQVEYTPNPDDLSPSYYPGPKYTYGAPEVANGFAIKRLAPAMRGFKLTYTNGGFLQGTMTLVVSVRNANTESPSLSLDNSVDESQANLATRGVVYAENSDVSGSYHNIQHKNGGWRVSLAETERQLAISPLTAFETNGTSVGSATAVQIATGLTAGTKTISLKTRSSNSKVIYIGPNSSVTTANGYPLDAGDAIELELNEGAQIWAISSSGSQSIHWMAINTHEDEPV